jgi:RNA polymerase sigma-70 factor (ECF subfamily)
VEDRPPQAAGPDADRVRAALAGDPAAFGDLYDRYARVIRAVCHDATRNLATLRDAERFAGWLVGIARMTCREWRKQAARDRRHRRPLDPDRVDPGGQDAAGDDAAEQLLQAIARLPQRERLALHLFYLQERPAEVAQETMRLSRSGFYRVLDRARRRLRRAIGLTQGRAV